MVCQPVQHSAVVHVRQGGLGTHKPHVCVRCVASGLQPHLLVVGGLQNSMLVILNVTDSGVMHLPATACCCVPLSQAFFNSVLSALGVKLIAFKVCDRHTYTQGQWHYLAVPGSYQAWRDPAWRECVPDMLPSCLHAGDREGQATG